MNQKICKYCRSLRELINWEANDAIICTCGITGAKINPGADTCSCFKDTIEDGKNVVPFKWIFEIGEKALAIDLDGASVDDKFEIIGRSWDDDEQHFTIRRLSDKEVWEGVGAMDLIEIDVRALSFENADHPFSEFALLRVIKSMKNEIQDEDIPSENDGSEFIGGAAIGNVMIDFTKRFDFEGRQYVLDYDIYVKGYDSGYGYLEDGTPYEHFEGGLILDRQRLPYVKSLHAFKYELVKELLSFCRNARKALPGEKFDPKEVLEKELKALL